jgi:hypothetical protein
MMICYGLPESRLDGGAFQRGSHNPFLRVSFFPAFSLPEKSMWGMGGQQVEMMETIRHPSLA